MSEISPDLLDQIVARVVEAIHPREIYLFGSHARNNPAQPHAHSDLDLLIVVDDEAGHEHQLFCEATAVLRRVMVPMDLIVMHRSSKAKWAPVKFSLAYEATRRGDRLYAA